MSIFHRSIVICRILGNEMPPRDVRGERLKALNWILNNEPNFPSSHKFWLINGVIDNELKSDYKLTLEANKQDYDFRPFSNKYCPSLPFYEKVRLAIDINGARNECIERMVGLYRFIAILDGDCFFTQESWDELQNTISLDQAGHSPVKYYSIPTQRLSPGDPGKMINNLTEAMIVFRNDAELRFDESRRFGDSPKQELLWRLGHSRERDRSQELIYPGLCISTSRVYHYAHGDAAELDHDHRGTLRSESLKILIDKIDMGIYGKNNCNLLG